MCPKCNHQFSIDIFDELKQFKSTECSECGMLIIPVDKFNMYVFKDARDEEWAMDIEDL
jgi:Zn ribbon nucleic-acid-binding protein